MNLCFGATTGANRRHLRAPNLRERERTGPARHYLRALPRCEPREMESAGNLPCFENRFAVVEDKPQPAAFQICDLLVLVLMTRHQGAFL